MRSDKTEYDRDLKSSILDPLALSSQGISNTKPTGMENGTNTQKNSTMSLSLIKTLRSPLLSPSFSLYLKLSTSLKVIDVGSGWEVVPKFDRSIF